MIATIETTKGKTILLLKKQPKSNSKREEKDRIKSLSRRQCHPTHALRWTAKTLSCCGPSVYSIR